jgi:hypothetical protein
MSHPLYDLLKKLDESHTYYLLSRNRDETVMVTITFVGERVEVEVFEDGHMEVSRFPGTEDILGGQELIYQLIDNDTFENKVREERSKSENKKHRH